ncbi:MAG TPA: lysophospholipid acyltransferase family protein [Verrucomicrobiae bacterium]
MSSSIIVALTKLIAGTGVRWTGCAPEIKQRIYFANHTSNLDALIVWTSLPKPIRARTRPVAARDYWIKGRVRRYLATKVFNAVLIERKKVTSNNNPLALLLEALDQNFSLIIFPEGGRNTESECGPFKSGLYHLGKNRPRVELIPAFIDNANRILPKGEVLPVPLLSSISFGSPIRVEQNETKVQFLERARNAVIQLKRS